VISAKVVQSSFQEEELMDPMVRRFRRAAARENRGRPLRRRYSPELQQDAIEYWQRRRGGEPLQGIAAALDVSPTTLQRWTRGASQQRPRFQPIQVVDVVPPTGASSGGVVIRMTTTGPQVEGLTVETAARLLALLR
jgi:transposase-like protein